MRPVPVVFLLFAFSDQLSTGSIRTSSVEEWKGRAGRRNCTLPSFGGRVSTRCTGVLLDVERAAPAATTQRVGFVL